MNYDIESIDFHQSNVLEHTILKLGHTLYDDLIEASREDEIAVLSELIGYFTLLASAYSLKTGHLTEDLGVGLNEAALLKLNAIKQNSNSIDNEWRHYAEDTKKVLERLEREIKR